MVKKNDSEKHLRPKKADDQNVQTEEERKVEEPAAQGRSVKTPRSSERLSGGLDKVPVIAMRGVVVYPGSSISFDIGRSESVAALKAAMEKGRQLFLVAQKDAQKEEPLPEDLYQVGTLAQIRQVLETGGNHYKVLADGQKRARALSYGREKGFMTASLEFLNMPRLLREERLLAEAGKRQLLKLFEHYAMTSGLVSPDTVSLARSLKNLHEILDLILVHMELSIEEKQQQLELTEQMPRVEAMLKSLAREIELSELGMQIDMKVRESLDRNQREYFLREQMRKIEEELGEDEANEVERMKEKLGESQMPVEYKEKILKEIDRFSRMPENFPETSVQRNWLDLLLELPFGKTESEILDLPRARKILDRDHYGLKKVKERILEYVAVRKLQVEDGDRRVKGPILCFVGPPGVGKTSVARSIAEALGRKYIRMSLGGIRDEAEIRGHRRTYVGAMPGRIMQGIRQVGSDNPLFLLDEIDKLGNDFRGDPSSALLEVLDPEQNNNFRDHYVEIPYDLSQVLFITTANTAYDIPEPLLDRMELIELSGYTEEEKIEIARRHLLPKQLKAHSLTKKHLSMGVHSLAAMISNYTSEAGVRQLERELAHVCRRVAVKIAEEKIEKITLRPTDLENLIGRRKYRFDMAEKKDQVGAVTGLAWTFAGGDTLTIEVNVLPGSGKMELTGQLGEVMKESARAALTYVRSRSHELGLRSDFASDCDIHIHIPAGAVPKDGPSAGITLATALASALSGRAARHNLAMTGEISLRGHVLPIGGLKEKLVAAKRARITTVLIPKENERDLEDVPETVLKKLEIITVETMDQVLSRALKPEVDLPSAATVLNEQKAPDKK